MKTFILTLLLSSTSFAQQVPTLTSPVMDLTQTITTKSEMESKIRSLYNDGSGPQITVLVIEKLEDTTIEQYAHKVFTTWKLGNAQRDDGVLFVLATKSRKVRIEVGQGLEGSLTDLHSKRILSKIRPHLASGNFSQGLIEGLDLIINNVSQKEAVQAPPSPSPKTNTTGTNVIMFLTLISTICLGIIVVPTVVSIVRHFISQKILIKKETLRSQSLSLEMSALEQKGPVAETMAALQKQVDDLKVKLIDASREKEVALKIYSSSTSKKFSTLQNELTRVGMELEELNSEISNYQEIIKRG